MSNERREAAIEEVAKSIWGRARLDKGKPWEEFLEDARQAISTYESLSEQPQGDERREAIAVAIFNSDNPDPDQPWSAATDKERRAYLLNADAVLAALATPSNPPTEAEVQRAANGIRAAAVAFADGGAVLPPTWEGWTAYAIGALTAARQAQGGER